MADINLIILICTFVVTVGTLSDYLLRNKEKTALRKRMENAFRKINESRYLDLTIFMSEKMISYFNYIFGEEKISIHRFLIIALLSGSLTLLSINTAKIIIQFPSLHFKTIGSIVVAVYIFYNTLIYGYRRIKNIFPTSSFLKQAVYCIIFGFISIYLPFINYSYYRIFISFRNGSINFIFDLLTLYITYKILILIRSSVFLMD